jgi:hypothetical protein
MSDFQDKGEIVVPERLGGVLRRLRAAVQSRLVTSPIYTSLGRKRLLSAPELDNSDRELLRAVSVRITRHDGMYTGDAAQYLSVGLSAARSIDAAKDAAGSGAVREILDMPSGSGRVMRFLRRRFPEATITACDLDGRLVNFCTEEFGALPVYSTPDIASLKIEGRFDLIWCGSLVTHLDQQPISDLLRFFRDHLMSGGLLVATTHGDHVARRRMANGEFDYGVNVVQSAALMRDYEERGFAYSDYPWQSGYGVSLTSPTWIRRTVEQIGSLEEVYFAERGWDAHQDVFGWVRRTEDA